ncbi:MAG: siderophore-interacting protein [Comamonas sp.]
MPLQLSLPTPPTPEQLEARATRRERHAIAVRRVQVARVQRLTPHMLRVTVQGDELQGFVSSGFDDHVKLLFPDADGRLDLPPLTEQGLPPGPLRDAMRDYTPHSFDAAARTLQLDFAVHEAGPATAWALQAAEGHQLGIAGPRGSMVVPTAFDGYLLVGDDTALPAISRRLRELPAGSQAIAVVEVDSAADELPLQSAAQLQVHWVHRNSGPSGQASGLLQVLERIAAPAGDYHVWIAAESAVAKALRAAAITQHGAHPAWTKAAAYWRRGSAAAHEVIEG